MDEGKTLYRMYVEQCKSIRTIAKELGWPKSRVGACIKKHEIAARKNGWSFKRGETSSSLKIPDNRKFTIYVTEEQSKKVVAKISSAKPNTTMKIITLLKRSITLQPQSDGDSTFTVRIEEQWKDKMVVPTVVTEVAGINKSTAVTIVETANKKLLTPGYKEKRKKEEVDKVDKLDVTVLYRLFVLQKLTPEEIANELNSDVQTVIEQLKKNHIISKDHEFQ